MKTFVVYHDGWYVQAYSLVFAESSDRARDLVFDKLVKMGIHKEDETYEKKRFKVVEFDKPESEGMYMIWDGNP